MSLILRQKNGTNFRQNIHLHFKQGSIETDKHHI